MRFGGREEDQMVLLTGKDLDETFEMIERSLED
jgi:hypothetical protein